MKLSTGVCVSNSIHFTCVFILKWWLNNLIDTSTKATSEIDRISALRDTIEIRHYLFRMGKCSLKRKLKTEISRISELTEMLGKGNIS